MPPLTREKVQYFYRTLILFFFFTLPLLSIPASLIAAVTLSPVEPWTAVFSEQETVFHFSISGLNHFDGRVGWKVACGGAIINRGEQHLTVGEGESEVIKVNFFTPKIKPGIYLDTMISVWALEKQSTVPLAESQKALTIFSPQFMENANHWLSKTDIHLFDPHKKTAEIFKREKIPFTAIHNPASIAKLKQGILILGERVSLNSRLGITPLLIKAATSGVPVLVLAPGGGDFFLPSIGESRDKSPVNVRSIIFRHEDIIRELHPKLDISPWSPGKNPVLSSISLRTRGKKLEAQINREANGWPWLELRFTDKNTALLFCGFSMIEDWDSNPTPRYLFASILQYMLNHNTPVIKEL